MSRRLLALAPVLAALSCAALSCAAPALAAPATTAPTATTQSVSATGSAEVKVVPANRHSNSSIVSAVDAAQKQAVPGALDAAHAKALIYAQGAGLTLGPLLSVSDAANGQVFVGPYGLNDNFGPFGQNKYCGTERRGVFERVNGRSKLIRTRKVHACFVPPYASATLTVTYSAT